MKSTFSLSTFSNNLEIRKGTLGYQKRVLTHVKHSHSSHHMGTHSVDSTACVLPEKGYLVNGYLKYAYAINSELNNNQSKGKVTKKGTFPIYGTQFSTYLFFVFVHFHIHKVENSGAN